MFGAERVESSQWRIEVDDDDDEEEEEETNNNNITLVPLPS